MSLNKEFENSKANPYAALAQNYTVPAAQADITDRLGFIRRTYTHLAGAIFAFVILEAAILTVFWEQIAAFMPSITGFSWLIVLGAFIGASWLAQRWAHSDTSMGMQYLGLSLYVVAQALIFVPLLFIAHAYFPGSIQSAAIITGVVFAGLTMTVFVSRADFSFLRMALALGTMAAFAAILAGTIFQLDIFGVVFSVAMVVLAAGYILYDTSNVLHRYRTDQHVGAALALFAGVALLFWYILRLVMILGEE